MSVSHNQGRRRLITGVAAIGVAAPALLAGKGNAAAKDGRSLLPAGESDMAITPQRFGARGDGESDDGTALEAALDAISRTPNPGGTISFPGMAMNLGTSEYSIADEVDLDFRRTWIKANPSQRLFSYGWGTKGAGQAIARPRVTGGNIRLSGVRHLPSRIATAR